VNGKSKGKSSGESEAQVIPNWCPFDPELQNAPKLTSESKKSKSKSKKGKAEDDGGNPFSFLDGIHSFPASTKVVILSKVDPTKCLQPTSVEVGGELIVDECRFDDDSIFTIDKYGRLHTSKWGLCAVANADRTDIGIGACFDCGAVLTYDPETTIIRLYEDSTNVVSYLGTDVFLAEEIVRPTCISISSQPDFFRLAGVLQTWLYVPIVDLKLPTTSPYPSFSASPTRTAMPTFSPTKAPTTYPTLNPTPSPRKITDDNINKAVELYMESESEGKYKYGDITNWDTSEVAIFYACFDKTSVQKATTFNTDIGDWDTSLGYYFNEMFRGAELFDQDIGAWDMSLAQLVPGMFFGALSFNQDISGWDVGTVFNFAQMFKNAAAFNQDLSRWDFGSAQYVEQMFWSSGLNIDQCFDLSGVGDPTACDIFLGSAGGDWFFCEIGKC